MLKKTRVPGGGAEGDARWGFRCAIEVRWLHGRGRRAGGEGVPAGEMLEGEDGMRASWEPQARQ
jgi:hypothetical protein